MDNIKKQHGIPNEVSEKFNNPVDNVRLKMCNEYLTGIADNPLMTKKEVCKRSRLKLGTMKNIQKHYKLDSPYIF
jgi:hypothetical protein